MSTKVEFHVLPSDSVAALDRYLCGQVAQWAAEGATVCILTDDLETAERVDGALWTFDEEAFVAHEIASDADARTGPPPLPLVLICTERTCAADILVNLSKSVPDGFQEFKRVVECIDAEPTRRDAGRRRFVVYRDRGALPDTFKIGS